MGLGTCKNGRAKKHKNLNASARSASASFFFGVLLFHKSPIPISWITWNTTVFPTTHLGGENHLFFDPDPQHSARHHGPVPRHPQRSIWPKTDASSATKNGSASVSQCGCTCPSPACWFPRDCWYQFVRLTYVSFPPDTSQRSGVQPRKANVRQRLSSLTHPNAPVSA